MMNFFMMVAGMKVAVRLVLAAIGFACMLALLVMHIVSEIKDRK